MKIFWHHIQATNVDLKKIITELDVVCSNFKVDQVLLRSSADDHLTYLSTNPKTVNGQNEMASLSFGDIKIGAHIAWEGDKRLWVVASGNGNIVKGKAIR